MLNNQIFNILTQISKGIACQFGCNCEVAIHDLNSDLNNTIVFIQNGHISNRQIGDGPSRAVLEAKNSKEGLLNDHLSYLMQTKDGKILKSSTIYIKDENNTPIYMLSINYDITSLILAQEAIKPIVNPKKSETPKKIIRNVTDLLDELINESVKLVGKPINLMTKDDKVKAIKFLNESGAFLITKSSDKISKFFGISKFTLYSYIDMSK